MESIQNQLMKLAHQFVPSDVAPAEAAALQEIEADLISGRSSVGAVIGELRKSYVPRPGEFGLEGLGAGLLALILPALFDFLRQFAGKLQERLMDAAADAASERITSELRKALSGKDRRAALLRELEAAFESRASELDLPRGSYAHLLEELDTKVEQALLVP